MADAIIPDKPPKEDKDKAVIGICGVCGGKMYDAILHVVVRLEDDKTKAVDDFGNQVCSYECYEKFRAAS